MLLNGGLFNLNALYTLSKYSTGACGDLGTFSKNDIDRIKIVFVAGQINFFVIIRFYLNYLCIEYKKHIFLERDTIKWKTQLNEFF